MDAGDWVAVVASLIAIGGMCATLWQAREAREARFAAQAQAAAAKDSAEIAEAGVKQAQRSAKAAEGSATEARKANEFARDKHEQEKIDREAAMVTEASKVRVGRTGGGGLWVRVTNHSSQSVFDVMLDSVIAEEDPSFKWKHNPRTVGVHQVASALQPEQATRWPVVFVSLSGEEKRMVGNRYDVTYSFTDGNGQRWQRTNDDVPKRVNTTVDRPPHESQSTESASEEDIRFQLLTLIDDRSRGNKTIDVDLLPSELGIDDAVIQRCLRRLYQDNLILAMSGDDRIGAVRGPTPGGQRLLEEQSM